MPHLLPSYLHTLRKQKGISQPDLASLLGITGSALSRFEGLSRRPNARLIVGAEVIFGHHAKDVFPAFYRDIERAVVKRARAEHDRMKTRTDPVSRRKLRLLSEISERASQATLNI